MTLPTQKVSVDVGIDRLLDQFKGKDLIVKFLTSYLTQVDITQTDTFSVLNGSSVYTATGAFLDNVGKLVNVNRSGSTDEEYRDRILDQILINTSEGTPKDVLNALKEITEATKVIMFEHFPANLHLYTNGSANLDTIADTLSSAVPATVSDITIIVDDVGGVFTPSELATTISSADTLITGAGDTIVTDQGDSILMRIVESVSDTSLAILPEFSLESDFQVDNGTGLDNFQVDTGSGLEDFTINTVGVSGDFKPFAEIRRRS